MQLSFSNEDEQFRAEVRAFLREHLPQKMRARRARGFHPVDADRRRWTKILHAHGWAVPHWPVEFGGCGWSALRQHIFWDECYRADAPPLNWFNVFMLGPVVYTFGTPEQKRWILPPTINADWNWCQGFSEPGSGSDLVSLKTSAVRDGDHYIVNGSKLWTTEGHLADMGFFLVRTDPAAKPQAGISFLVIDMKSPGVSVRPVVTIDGMHHTNQVFLDDVRVPAANLIGEPNKGWTYAKFLLDNERTTSAEIYWSRHALRTVRRIAAQETAVDGRPLLQDPAFARRLALADAELTGLEWSVLRVLANEPTDVHPNAIASALKARGSPLQQRISQLVLDAMGMRALRKFGHGDTVAAEESDAWPDYVPGHLATHLFGRVFTIYGGSLEIQKNIIAKLAFGL
ncbi:MAG: acyl-CoA dehydrogenase family protein [Gammaproteobacteria bacterium]